MISFIIPIQRMNEEKSRQQKFRWMISDISLQFPNSVNMFEFIDSVYLLLGETPHPVLLLRCQ